MTSPGKPQSSKQRDRLTAAGQQSFALTAAATATP